LEPIVNIVRGNSSSAFGISPRGRLENAISRQANKAEGTVYQKRDRSAKFKNAGQKMYLDTVLQI